MCIKILKKNYLIKKFTKLLSSQNLQKTNLRTFLAPNKNEALSLDLLLLFCDIFTYQTRQRDNSFFYRHYFVNAMKTAQTISFVFCLAASASKSKSKSSRTLRIARS